MHAGNELSEQVWNPWFGFLVLHSTELHCAPSTNASQLQVFWTEAFGDELGHVDCYLWSEGLHSVIEELCTKLLVVSLLSFWWIFVLIVWFEGLELLFFSLNLQCRGLHEEDEGKWLCTCWCFTLLGRKGTEERTKVSKSRLNISGPWPLHVGEDDLHTSEYALV